MLSRNSNSFFQSRTWAEVETSTYRRIFSNEYIYIILLTNGHSKYS